jgi:four helix bundle protein
MGLAEAVYRFTRTLPPQERFGIAAQLQRAAVSVPANLAEGHCRRTQRAYAQHVSIALGSQGVETLLELTARLNFGEDGLRREAIKCVNECGRVMYGLFRRLDERR